MSATLRQKSLPEFQPVAMNLATDPHTQVPNKKSKTSLTVLIADADRANLALLTKLIEKEGFTVLVANDGREARKILQDKSDFIAAIFKAVIPHVSGPDLVRYMRREEHLRNIPVIMMTQADSIRILCESLAAGAAALLPEPFSTSQVQNLLHLLVDSNASPKPTRT